MNLTQIPLSTDFVNEMYPLSHSQKRWDLWY